MLGRVTIRKDKKVVIDLLNQDGREPLVMDSVEIDFDQHFGIRITPGEEWTEVAVRKAGSWSAPVDSRELVERVRDAQRVKLRPRPRRTR
jgi:hypothetical protein